jgi:hypothetical protein
MPAIIKHIHHYITIVANISSSSIQLIKIHIHTFTSFYSTEMRSRWICCSIILSVSNDQFSFNHKHLSYFIVHLMYFHQLIEKGKDMHLRFTSTYRSRHLEIAN